MNKALKLILVIILFFLFFLYLFLENLNQNESFSFFIISLNLLGLVLFSLRLEPQKSINNQYVRIIIIFIVGYVIVFFQLHVDYFLGNFSEDNTRFWVNSKIVPKSLIISSIGFYSIILGYVYQINKFKTTTKNHYKYSSPIIGYSILSLFFLLLMIYTINPLYLLGGYGNFEMGNTARYSSILFELSYIAGIIQALINKSNLTGKKRSFYFFFKSIGFLHLSLFIIYSLIILISGDRGPIIYLIVGLSSAYIISTKWKISKIKIFVLFFCASTLISSMVVLRNSTNDNTPIFYKLYSALVDGEAKAFSSMEDSNSISNSTFELALSIRTLHNSVNSVPSEHSYFYGQFQFLQIVTVIPLGQILIKNYFEINDSELTSAKYVTDIVGGIGGSEGTNCITDLYLDFGVIGVFLGMFFFGRIIRNLEENTFREKLPKLIILISYVVICQYAIYIPRSTLMFNFRNIVWIFLIIKFIQLISPKRIIKYNETNY